MRNTQQGKSGRGAEQQDDDEALLSSLGVTAADPVDIERTLLAQVSCVPLCFARGVVGCFSVALSRRVFYMGK